MSSLLSSHVNYFLSDIVSSLPEDSNKGQSQSGYDHGVGSSSKASAFLHHDIPLHESSSTWSSSDFDDDHWMEPEITNDHPSHNKTLIESGRKGHAYILSEQADM